MKPSGCTVDYMSDSSDLARWFGQPDAGHRDSFKVEVSVEGDVDPKVGWFTITRTLAQQ